MLIYPKTEWTQQVAGIFEGNPAMCMDASGNLYSAVRSEGGLVLISTSPTGIERWRYAPPELVATGSAPQPAIILGLTGEVYVAFVTTGAIPGSQNMTDPGVINLCGTCTTNKAPEDLVIARIDGVLSGTPFIAWTVQDVRLNTCSAELLPSLALDVANKRLIIAYQSRGSVIGSAAIGTTNVTIAGLDLITGELIWSYQSDQLNFVGENTYPSVTTDDVGNIYVAYTVASPSSSSLPDVYVTRFHTEGSPIRIVRDWITNAISSPTEDLWPTLTYSNGRLYMAFITDTSDNSRTLILACLDIDGSLVWIKDADIFNEPSYHYAYLSRPTIFIQGTSMYISFQTELSVLAFSVHTETGESRWYYVDNRNNTFRGFVVSSTTNNLLPTVIAATAESVFVGYCTSDQRYFIEALKEGSVYADITSFDYMANYSNDIQYVTNRSFINSKCE